MAEARKAPAKKAAAKATKAAGARKTTVTKAAAPVRKRTPPGARAAAEEAVSAPPARPARASKATAAPPASSRTRVPGARKAVAPRRAPVPEPEPAEWEPEPEPEIDELDDVSPFEDGSPFGDDDDEFGDEQPFHDEPDPARPVNKFASLRERLAAAAAQIEGGASGAPAPAPGPRRPVRAAEPEPEPEPEPEEEPETPKPKMTKRAATKRPAGGRTSAPPRRPLARPVAAPAPVEPEPVDDEDEDEDEDGTDEVEVVAATPTVEINKQGYVPPLASTPRWETTSTPVTPAGSSYTPSFAPSYAPSATPPMPPPPVVRPAPTPPLPSEPKERSGLLKILAIVVGIAVVVIIGIVAVLSLTGGDEDGVKYSDLKAGDCFETPSGRFNNVETVPCTKSHDLEVYAVLDHPAGPGDAFPGMDELVRYANPLCLAQFRAYAGVAFEQLSLSDKYITPRDSAWEDGARRIVCVVGQSNDEPSDKSIKAAS